MIYFVMSCFVLTWSAIILLVMLLREAHKDHCEAIDDLEDLMQEKFSELRGDK